MNTFKEEKGLLTKTLLHTRFGHTRVYNSIYIRTDKEEEEKKEVKTAKKNGDMVTHLGFSLRISSPPSPPSSPA